MTDAATQSPASVTMEAFFTRQRANEGVELPLFLPDGTPTTHRIRIRGVDSDAFRAAFADSKRRLLELAQSKDKSALDSANADEERLTLIASLVISWTFTDKEGKPLPCTPEAVRNLLREAPQLVEAIDQLASRRSLFFGRG